MRMRAIRKFLCFQNEKERHINHCPHLWKVVCMNGDARNVYTFIDIKMLSFFNFSQYDKNIITIYFRYTHILC